MEDQPPVTIRSGQALERRDRLPTPVPERQILGRYEVVGEPIKGANSIIYKARDIETSRIVAVKEVNMKHCTIVRDFKPMDLVEREYKVGEKLNHDNLTAYHDCVFDEENNRVLLVRDWVEGISLQEWTGQGQTLTDEQIVQIMDCVLDAVAYLHEQRIIHRDIKPANIIVQFEGEEVVTVKLIDLGAVLEQPGADSPTRISTCIGTYGYMAKEAQTDPRSQSDLFSVGATLLYLCCKKNADDTYESDKGVYVIPRKVKGNFRVFLQKTLQVAVEKRVQTAEQLKAILHRGSEPKWGERRMPITFLRIRKIEGIIASDSFHALASERQEALMDACLERFFSKKDIASKGPQRETVLARIAEYPMPEEVAEKILSDDSLSIQFAPGQKANLASRITDEENAEKLLRREDVRECPEMEGVLAARITDGGKVSQLLRWVVKGPEAQKILANMVSDEAEASAILGLDDFNGKIVSDNPGAQRILASKITNGRTAAQLLAKACVSDAQAQQMLATRVEDENIANQILIQKMVFGNPGAERILASKIEDGNVAKRLLDSVSVGDSEAQQMLAHKITTGRDAPDLTTLKSLCPEAQRILVTNLSPPQNVAALTNVINSLTDPQAQQILAGKVDEQRAFGLLVAGTFMDNAGVQRILASKLTSSNKAEDLLTKVTDPQAQQTIAGLVEDNGQAFVIFNSGVLYHNPGAQRALAPKITYEIAANRLLSGGGITDPEAERILASRIMDGGKASNLLQGGRVKYAETQKTLACRVDSRSAMGLLGDRSVWRRTDIFALVTLISTANGMIREDDAYGWLLNHARDPHTKEALLKYIGCSETAEPLLMRGVFQDNPDSEQRLARFIRESNAAHGLLRSGSITSPLARSLLAEKVTDEDSAYTLLLEGKARDGNVQKNLAQRIRLKWKARRLLDSGCITDPEALQRLRSI